MKRNRLTVVTAKMPKGIAEPNRKKLLTRTAVGLCVKNDAQCSAGAKGVTKDAPCRSAARCCETSREEQDVNRREQDQRWTTESGSRFHNKIIYTINEYNVQ